ncbi:MAG: hypothetical protein ABIC57_01035 [bacterium]
MKNQPVQVDPNKDLDPNQKEEDIKSLKVHREIRLSSTTGQPEKQEASQTKVINPFSND